MVVVCLAALPFVYRAAHRPTSTEARFEDGLLVVRDPNPWWKRLAPVWVRELRLEVDSVEQGGVGPVAVCSSTPWWRWAESYRVQLKAGEKEEEALHARLAEMEK